MIHLTRFGNPHSRAMIAVRRMLLLATLALVCWYPANAQQKALRIGILLPQDDVPESVRISATRGAELAVGEVERMASLLGRELEVLIDSTGTAPEVFADPGVLAIIGGYEPEACRKMAAAATQRGVLFFDAGCEDDALRGAQCSRMTFHVAASEAMKRDAAAMVNASEGHVVEWHPELFRYGAGQLNDRFSQAFDDGMDAVAWSTWISVKIAAESALRVGTSDVEALLAYLGSESTRFDGHKGLPLSFRSWDHQLRQPLYVEVNRAGDADDLIEVPKENEAEAVSPQSILDRLGTGADDTTCQF